MATETTEAGIAAREALKAQIAADLSGDGTPDYHDDDNLYAAVGHADEQYVE